MSSVPVSGLRVEAVPGEDRLPGRVDAAVEPGVGVVALGPVAVQAACAPSVIRDRRAAAAARSATWSRQPSGSSVDGSSGRPADDREQVGPGPRARTSTSAYPPPPVATHRPRRPRARARAARGTTRAGRRRVSIRWASGSSMCESQPCWVTSTVGRERAHQRRHDRVERPQPAGVGGARRQRDVDRGALGAAARRCRVGKPVPGNSICAGLVQARSSAPAGRRRTPPRRRRRGARRRRRTRPARRPGRAATGCRPRRRCRCRSRSTRSRIAWCRPPVMLAACSALAASTPAGTPRGSRRRRGRSRRACPRRPGCRRCRGRGRRRRSVAGSLPAARHRVDVAPRSWTVAICSSSANGAGTSRRRPCRARRGRGPAASSGRPGSGTSGAPARSRRPSATSRRRRVAGPTHSMVARYSVRLPWPRAQLPNLSLVARLLGGPPR